MKPFLILLAVAASLLAAAPHPSLPAIGSLDGLGVNIHFTDPQPGEFEMIKAAGFRWVRMDLSWAGTEKVPGTYDFGPWDRLTAALEKNGMRAVFILDYGNPLYAEPGDQQPFTSLVGTDEFRAAYARWAAATVAHFAGKGFLFEIWNEPNHEDFWKPKADVKQYAAMAKAACEAIAKAAPQEAIIGPATSTIDLPFLEECFKAGLLEHWCAVSVHPYRQQAPETVEEEYRNLRLLIARYAPKDRAIPILSGEWGYSTAYSAFAGKTEPEAENMQAKYLARMFLTNVANEVPLSIWYDWRDDGDNPKEAEHRFGIVRRAFRKDAPEPFEPKPAYSAALNLRHLLEGRPNLSQVDALKLLLAIRPPAPPAEPASGVPAFETDQPLSATSDGAPDALPQMTCEGLLGAAPGAGAATLRYHFVSGWRFIEIKPQSREWPSGADATPKAFGLWIHGDGKGCHARLRFTDSTGQTFQPDGPKIDFTGWRFAKFSLQTSAATPLSHWGGANDGIIHPPIKWDTVFLLDNVSRLPVEGEVQISTPTLFY